MINQHTLATGQPTAVPVSPHFVQGGDDPYALVDWVKRDAVITAVSGEEVFRQNNVEFPVFWSETATNIVASKYFRTVFGERETSVRDMVNRVASALATWGEKDGYFTSAVATTFYQELSHILLNQMASFNSPVWFNVGVPGSSNQSSACFLLSVDDSMDSITDWYRDESVIFKGGSGAGVNVSNLRAENEPLSLGGRASGPLSWMKVADTSAGAIKSGGTTRRAAKMVCMDVDHPDILKFIWAKVHEETKARVLMAAGYSDAVDGEALASVAYQNANHSVRLPDGFMQAVEAGKGWETAWRTNPQWTTHYAARELFTQLAQAAWTSGDPGVMFSDTTARWHTCPMTGPITTSNPCQPAFATVLMPHGIQQFKDIVVGSIIWSGTAWTKVVRKVCTGTKKVYRYRTSAGEFVGTSEHQVFSEGVRTPVNEAHTIDLATGPLRLLSGLADDFDAQAVVDGLVLGDGTAKTLTTTAVTPYVLLHVGKEDRDYFSPDSGVADFIHPQPFDKTAHRVKTTFEHADMVRTYEREVPDRYFYGSPQVQRSFLRGLYSANGSVAGNRVTLKAASFALIQRVQVMLSALGIRSYYTTNKAHEVTFKNGTYLCKESYDLNISVDRGEFQGLINFIQVDKQQRLARICQTVSYREKNSYEVREREYLGRMPVYDITVANEEHTYWTGGLLVSNCGEFVFLDNTACNLSSINLLKFLEADGTFDVDGFSHVVDIMLLAQEILVSNSNYPTPNIDVMSEDYRPLGLGFANLGALLMAKGLPYDSSEGRDLAASITALMTGRAYARSAQIAKVKGAFTGFYPNREAMLGVILQHTDALAHLDNSRIFAAACDAWNSAYEVGSVYGFRNAQVTLLAPTGTISFMMDCTTTGVEPDVALVSYKKLVGGGTLKHVNDQVPRALAALNYPLWGIEMIRKRLESGHDPDDIGEILEDHRAVFDCAFPTKPGGRSIAWQGHVKMVAALQPFLSGAISKTINLPTDATVDDVESAFMLAWKLGVKNVALYRDGCKHTQVLTTEAHTRVVEELSPLPLVDGVLAPKRRRLPDERQAFTHKFSLGGVHEGYLTVGLYEDGTPGEIFLKMAKEGSTLSGFADGFAVMVSVALQYGVPLHTLVEKFSYTRFEPSGWTSHGEIRYANSILDYVFRYLGQKFLTPTSVNAVPDPTQDVDANSTPLARPRIDVDGKRGVGVGSPLVDALASWQVSDTVCGHCGALMLRSGTCHICNRCGNSSGCSG